MAYARSELALPSLDSPHASIRASVVSLGGSLAESLRKQWIYHRTLSQLEGYSERNLLDLGAARGVEDFARRAAGF